MLSVVLRGFGLLAIIASTDASTAPKNGCYYFELANGVFDIEAQINVKSSSELDFTLVFQADPTIGMPDTRLNCENELYYFDESTSSVVVGSDRISPCLQALSDFSKGVVTIPMNLGFDSATDSFKFVMVIEIVMPRAPKCKSYTWVPKPVASKAVSTPAAPIANVLAESTTATTTSTTTKGEQSIFGSNTILLAGLCALSMLA
jgi:hypothetical protein